MPTADDLVFQEDGEIEARVGTAITFYLTQLEGATEGLVAAYQQVLVHLAPQVRWYRTERMKRSAPVTPEALQSLPLWFSGKWPRRLEYGLILTSGQTALEVGPWGFQFFIASRNLDLEAGYFQVHLPAEWLRDEPDKVVSLARSVAEVLPFRSGHAGYGIQHEEGAVLAERDARIRAWCRRYWGLDCPDLAGIRPFVVGALKGVNWLTFLDREFCERVGGLEALRESLPPPISLTELRSGCMIQAGSAPGLGDRNRREDPGAYRQVNEVLKPLRMESNWSPGWCDADEALEWLERFD
jgi:hypothetical protein